jgi:DNA-binding transcriptional regulator GbsR (MarR family)
MDFLINNLRTPVYKNEIIERTGLSRNSFFKAWKKFEKYGIVKPTKTWKSYFV